MHSFLSISIHIYTDLSKDDNGDTFSSSKDNISVMSSSLKDENRSKSSLSKLNTGDSSYKSTQKQSTYPLFVSKYDYLATNSDELSFKKGTLFYIINNEEDWWYARAECSGKEGYIPSNYLEEHKPLETYG